VSQHDDRRHGLADAARGNDDHDERSPRVAYYSMEVAVEDRLPTYSGGLGVLAGDVLRAAADLAVPMVGVTLLYNRGFFRQTLDAEGLQHEAPVPWRPGDLLEELVVRVGVQVGERRVLVRPWRLVLRGVDGGRVPVYFLDTDVQGNHPDDRRITDRLYLGDRSVRLAQEAVLGLGGVAVLERLGHRIDRHHLNEGHAALVPLALLALRDGEAEWTRSAADRLLTATQDDVERVRGRCVFTTHTPVPAGHDRFGSDVVAGVLGHDVGKALGKLDVLEEDGTLNMTLLALRSSSFVNAVSERHREVTCAMFPGARVEAITNGVHGATWAAPATAELLDRRLPGWRRDATRLHYAGGLPVSELRQMHARSKADLAAEVRARTGALLDVDAFTIGVARRVTAYKRNDLVLSEPERLLEIARRVGPLQILYSGKAHPEDEPGKEMIRRINAVASQLGGDVSVVYVPDYGMTLGRTLCGGCDLWLNTPERPHEASGTSGMKAALNAVPSLSTLDGWWIEGHLEGITGWGVGPDDPDHYPAHDADALYRALEHDVAPLYYRDPDGYAAVGRHALALNGPFFSAQRMVEEYVRRAYRMGEAVEPSGAG